MYTQENLLVEWLVWTDYNRRGLFLSCPDHNWSAEPRSHRLQSLRPRGRTFEPIQRKGCEIGQSRWEASSVTVLGEKKIFWKQKLKEDILKYVFTITFFKNLRFMKFWRKNLKDHQVLFKSCVMRFLNAFHSENMKCNSQLGPCC